MTFSTTRLSKDVVSQFPITFIPGNSFKLGVKYSILVRQIALSQSGFEYYERSKSKPAKRAPPLPSDKRLPRENTLLDRLLWGEGIARRLAQWFRVAARF